MRLSGLTSTRKYLAALTAVLVAYPAVGQAAPSPEERLAGQFARSALRLLRQDHLSVKLMEASLILIHEATQLAPNDPELWRAAAAIASLSERSDVRDEALARLAELDPADEVVRLKLKSRQLEQAQTAEELAKLLESMLQPEQRDRLGPAIVSRLAFDLALLERRRGESDQFAARLAEAVAFDPSNHRAAALALGYFQAHVDDPVAEGELLMQLVLANPGDVEAQVLFASHLLGFGAYRGAERFYANALRSHIPIGAMPVPNLVADAAIAHFGSGDAEGALRRLEEHQRQRDLILQQRLFYERPGLSPLERAAHKAVLTPTFVTVRAAIASRLDRDIAPSLEAVRQSYSKAVDEALATESEDRRWQAALLRLEMAWVLLWLGGDIEESREALDSARAEAELSEAAEARFSGWEAIRLGEFPRAESVLSPHAEHDPPSRLGLAIAQIEQGRRRDGARELLALARSQPGTLIGVMAADQLAEALGQRVSLSPEAGALEALAMKAPRILDRLSQDPSAAVAIRVLPVKARFSAYDPLLLDIEITNGSPIPLAIDPEGPIRPEVAIQASIEAAGAPRPWFQPIIIGIDRRLRLMPRERLTVRVDLRTTDVGDFLDQYPLQGSIVRLRAMLNFRATAAGALVSGPLGSETTPQSVRVEGARSTRAWLESVLDSLVSPSDAVDLPQLALMMYAVAGDPPPGTRPEDRRLTFQARDAFASVFAELDAFSQAWLMSVLPNIDSVNAAMEPGQRMDERPVRLAHLLYRTRDPADPMLGEVLRGTDRDLRLIATLARDFLDAGEADLLPQLQDEQPPPVELPR